MGKIPDITSPVPAPFFGGFRGKNLKNPRNLHDPHPQNIPKIVSGISGEKTPKNSKIELIPVPKKTPKFFQTLSPSPPRPRNSGTGTGKIGDWGPVPPPYPEPITTQGL